MPSETPSSEAMRERAIFDAGFRACRGYGDNWVHHRGEQAGRVFDVAMDEVNSLHPSELSSLRSDLAAAREKIEHFAKQKKSSEMDEAYMAEAGYGDCAKPSDLPWQDACEMMIDDARDFIAALASKNGASDE